MTNDASRLTVPSDVGGRNWVASFPSGDGNPIEKHVIATLIAADDDLQTWVLGTAFVVAASGNRAVCMCAAHSLEQVAKFENARRHQSMWVPPPDLVKVATKHLSPKRMHAIFQMDGQLVVCAAGQLNYVAGYDVAIFEVVAPDERAMFHKHIALDFAIPRVGAEVAILTNDITHTPLPDHAGELELRHQMRSGVVTEVAFEPAMQGQSFVFYTTIPATPGMSGSPAVFPSGIGTPVRACGVVSSDLSPLEAFSSFGVAGRSAISMVWPALGLGILGRTDDDDVPRYYSLAEMKRAGFIDDRTQDAKVSLFQSKEITQILYEDDLYGRVLLELNGHPNARE